MTNTQSDTLLVDTLRRLQIVHGTASPARDHRRFSPDAYWIAGLETVAPGDHYSWDGLRRGGDPARPFVVFQVTLAGYGAYELTTEVSFVERLVPGHAFVAVVPGAHRYYLPEDATEGWAFFWIMMRHPYVVARIAERQRAPGFGRAATFLDAAPDTVLFARAVSLLADDYANTFDEEAACFAFLTEFERHVHVAASGSRGADGDGSAQQALLAHARALFLRDPSRPIGVADLARAESMSRTRYSHHFKAATGQPPAQFISRIRLEEVARQLARTDATLARIAADTGFADANHLCKAFRRRNLCNTTDIVTWHRTLSASALGW